MTAMAGMAAGLVFFIGGLVCWFMDMNSIAVPLLAGAYLCEGYGSSIIVNYQTRTLRQAVELIELLKGRSVK